MAKKKKTEPTPLAPLNTTGELRLIANKQGWFVVGTGLQFAVETREAGHQLIETLKTGKLKG